MNVASLWRTATLGVVLLLAAAVSPAIAETPPAQTSSSPAQTSSSPAQTSSSPAPAAPPEFTINTGGWRGGAQARPDNPNQFSHCGISREYPGGTTLIFMMGPNYQTNIGLLNASWSLTEGHQETIRLRIDQAIDGQGPAFAGGPHVLIIPVGTEPQLIEKLRTGSAMAITTSLGESRFPLTGTGASLTALRACVDKARELIAQQPQPAGQPAAAPAAPVGLGLDGLAEIMAAAGVHNVWFMAPAEVPQDALELRHSWRVGNTITGGLHQQPRGDISTFEGFVDSYVGILQGRCPGQFTKTAGNTDVFRDIYAVKSVTIECTAPQGTSVVALVFTADDNSFSVFFHEGAGTEKEAVQQQSDKIATLVRQLASAAPAPAAAATPAPAAAAGSTSTPRPAN